MWRVDITGSPATRHLPEVVVGEFAALEVVNGILLLAEVLGGAVLVGLAHALDGVATGTPAVRAACGNTVLVDGLQSTRR